MAPAEREEGSMCQQTVTGRRLGVLFVASLSLLLPARVAWSADSTEPCRQNQEGQTGGRCEPPCPTGQFRHPAGYCTCGVPLGDPAAAPSCAEAVTAKVAPNSHDRAAGARTGR